MNLFTWFKRSDDKLGLRTALGDHTMSVAAHRFESSPTMDGLASALSSATLFTAGQFADGVTEHLSSLPISATEYDLTRRTVAIMHDVATIEAAAFCHFQLIKSYLREDEKPPDADPAFVCLKNSMAMTARFINTHGTFDLPATFFMDRANYYAKHLLEDEFDKFEETLIDSIFSGGPAFPKQVREALEGELAVDIAVRLNARIFSGTSLPALMEFSDRLWTIRRNSST